MPTACIATPDELTIHRWSGKPVAYLNSDSAGGCNVSGFNGMHLGWFVKGIIWDHLGDVWCAVKDRMNTNA